MILDYLIAEAVALAGGNLCASGHDWKFSGGRHCDYCYDSQPVFRCVRCGEWDYGNRGGPGWEYCSINSDCVEARMRNDDAGRVTT